MYLCITENFQCGKVVIPSMWSLIRGKIKRSMVKLAKFAPDKNFSIIFNTSLTFLFSCRDMSVIFSWGQESVCGGGREWEHLQVLNAVTSGWGHWPHHRCVSVLILIRLAYMVLAILYQTTLVLHGAGEHDFKSPIKFVFRAHHGPVYGICCSPFHRNLFLSCSTDASARLYSLLDVSLFFLVPHQSELHTQRLMGGQHALHS